jgi:hypothetical protein
MVSIFNIIQNRSIQIDESMPGISAISRSWDREQPHVSITIPGFVFYSHASKCSDCAEFLAAFGTKSVDWFISIRGEVHRLDLSEVGTGYHENRIKCSIGPMINVTEFNLLIDDDTVESLTLLLEANEVLENYECCCAIREKIIGILKTKNVNWLAK